MPSTYNGSATGITPHQNPAISCPVDSDAPNANSVNTPLQKLADFVAYLMAHAPLLDQLNTFAQRATLAGGATIASGAAITGGATVDTLNVSGALGTQSTIAASIVSDLAAVLTSTGPSASGKYKLLHESAGFAGSSSGTKRRIYVYGADDTLAIVFTFNASWNGTAWVRDNVANVATMFRLDVVNGEVKNYTWAPAGSGFRGFADLRFAPLAMGRVVAGSASSSLSWTRDVGSCLHATTPLAHQSAGLERINLNAARFGVDFHAAITPIDNGAGVNPILSVVYSSPATFDVKARNPSDGSAFSGNWGFTFEVYANTDTAVGF